MQRLSNKPKRLAQPLTSSFIGLLTLMALVLAEPAIARSVVDHDAIPALKEPEGDEETFVSSETTLAKGQIVIPSVVQAEWEFCHEGYGAYLYLDEAVHAVGITRLTAQWTSPYAAPAKQDLLGGLGVLSVLNAPVEPIRFKDMTRIRTTGEPWSQWAARSFEVPAGCGFGGICVYFLPILRYSDEWHAPSEPQRAQVQWRLEAELTGPAEMKGDIYMGWGERGDDPNPVHNEPCQRDQSSPQWDRFLGRYRSS